MGFSFAHHIHAPQEGKDTMNQPQSNRVSYEEEQATGLLRITDRNGSRLVKNEIMKQTRPAPMAMPLNGYAVSVPVSTVQTVEVRTSAVDRSKGFLIAGLPLYAAFGVGMLIVAVALFDTPVLSLTGFLIFWGTFVLAWGWGYFQSLRTSAEGVSLYEARRKWDTVQIEQKERWDYYKQVNRDN